MKNNTRKVWVNPVYKTSAQGRDKQYYQTYDKNGMAVRTQHMQKTKEFSTGNVYTFPFNTETGRMYTGLNMMIDNPLKGLDIDELILRFNIDSDWHEKLPTIVEKDTISKQAYYEIKHGEAPGAYSSNRKYSMFNMPIDMKKFNDGAGKLDSFKLTLYPRPNMFTTATPRQELAILLVEALVKAGKIAPSKDQANPATHEFYISEDNAEEAAYSKKRDIIESAIHRLYELKEKSPYIKQYQFATILRTKSNQTLVKGDSTPERVKGLLSEYVSDRNKNQLEHVDRLIKLYDLQLTPEGADRFHIKYLIQQAINTNVILHRDNEYVWLSKSGTPDLYNIGSSFEQLEAFFLKEMNTPVPKGKKVVANYYQDLLSEVKNKNVLFD